MTLRAVLFDLDDTLHNKSATLQLAASEQFASEKLAWHGIRKPAWQEAYLALNNLRIGKAEVFSRLGKQFELPSELEQRLLQNYHESIGKSVRAYRGAFAFLNECKSRGLKVGIVTNGQDALQRRKIAGLGIGHLIDSLVTSGGFGIKKPDHKIFCQCLTELAIDARDAAFVGDNFSADMEPALALGMQAVWKSAAKSDKVSFSSDSLSEIQAFLFSEGHTLPKRTGLCPTVRR
jgi:putative hydrolase of the HAD superfamily